MMWVIIVLLSLGLHSLRHYDALIQKRNLGLEQELNTKNYLLTNDMVHLRDKPFFHIPYPDPERLASILASPTIQSILPTNIRGSLVKTSTENQPVNVVSNYVKVGKLDLRVTQLLDNYEVFIILGLIVGVFLSVKVNYVRNGNV